MKRFFRDWKSALLGAAFIFGLLLIAGLLQGCTTVRADEDCPDVSQPNADELQRADPPSLYCRTWPDRCTNLYDA